MNTYTKHPCRFCGKKITRNGLGHTQHYRMHSRNKECYEITNDDDINHGPYQYVGMNWSEELKDGWYFSNYQRKINENNNT